MGVKMTTAAFEYLREGWPRSDAGPAGSSAGRICALGIGSVEASTASLKQMALAILLAEELALAPRLWADPQMSAVDAAVGQAFGFEPGDFFPPEHVAMAKAGATDPPLLFYMPHCDRWMYEAVLDLNLSVEAGHVPLSRVALIGNSFEAYDLRSLQQASNGGLGDWELMKAILPLLSERRLPAYPACAEVFNDLAVISFPESSALESLMHSLGKK